MCLLRYIFAVAAGLLLVISSNTVLFADDVVFLRTPAEAIQARYEAMLNADEVWVATYLFNEDQVGLAQLGMLQEHARRGGKSHFLYDAIQSTFSQETIQNILSDRSLDDRFDLRVYNPLSANFKNPSKVNQRLHSKLFIARQKGTGELIVISGGRNLVSEYFGGNPTGSFRDVEVWVKGEAAEKALQYLQEVMNDPLVRVPGRLNSVRDVIPWIKQLPKQIMDGVRAKNERSREIRKRKEAFDQKLKSILALVTDAQWFQKIPFGKWKERMHKNVEVEFNGSLRIPKERSQLNPVSQNLVELIKGARSSVDIANPYVLLTPKFRDALKNAVERGVRVRIVTNTESDHKIVTEFYRKERPDLLDLGIELYEYSGPGWMHKKVVIVDDRHSYVGTHNLDPRSEFWNLEVGFTMDSKALSQEIKKSVESQIRNGVLIDSAALAPRPSGCQRAFGRVWDALNPKRLVRPFL